MPKRRSKKVVKVTDVAARLPLADFHVRSRDFYATDPFASKNGTPPWCNYV